MTQDVITEKRGALGLIILDRPKALHALTEAMCSAIHAGLDRFASDPEVGAVIIESTGDRAFCAGGDVVTIVQSGRAGGDLWERFFATEYAMNLAIARFPKPYVALMDGVTMGGGVGISIHGSHRVATERTLWAMPETGIGMVTDVGTSYALPRLPGRLGLFLALTGARLDGAETLAAGIATHFLASDRQPDLKDALASGEAPDTALARLASDPGPARISANRTAIDRLFAGGSVEAILAALDADPSDWAQTEAATLRRLSPSALKVVFEALRRGATSTIEAALLTEYRVACHFKQTKDFYEGVRALLIDKDKSPHWDPPTLEAVTPERVAAHFEAPPGGDLVLQARSSV